MKNREKFEQTCKIVEVLCTKLVRFGLIAVSAFAAVGVGSAIAQDVVERKRTKELSKN